ncbi:hypothetical protein CA51_11100 [Rosistilla oblonga]|nr:hypothetical protein CA51_11100 [Rosistilla oblonga]
MGRLEALLPWPPIVSSSDSALCPGGLLSSKHFDSASGCFRQTTRKGSAQSDATKSNSLQFGKSTSRKSVAPKLVRWHLGLANKLRLLLGLFRHLGAVAAGGVGCSRCNFDRLAGSVAGVPFRFR